MKLINIALLHVNGNCINKTKINCLNKLQVVVKIEVQIIFIIKNELLEKF